LSSVGNVRAVCQFIISIFLLDFYLRQAGYVIVIVRLSYC